MNSISILTSAYEFAARKHTLQRRKGVKNIPYINHPVEVTKLLSFTGNANDLILLIAGVLHDTIEDTDTSEEEIKELFGQEVSEVVMEVTDDMSQPKKIRRQKQIDNALSISDRAKQIKIADKTCNILDMLTTRVEWTKSMKRDYVIWAKQVVENCRGVNTLLEKEFDKAVALANEVLGEF